MLHQKIRDLRKSKNLSYEDMAERLGISRSAYARWETGKARPDVDRLKKAAEIFEVPPEHLLDPEPVVFNIQNNSGGSNGCWYNQQLTQHFPEDLMKQFFDRQDSLAKDLQQMNARLLELLEKKLG